MKDNYKIHETETESDKDPKLMEETLVRQAEKDLAPKAVVRPKTYVSRHILKLIYSPLM